MSAKVTKKDDLVFAEMHYTVHRRFATGLRIHGTAARAPLFLRLAEKNGKWSISLSGDGAADETRHGSGSIEDAIDNATNLLLPFAAKMARRLTSGDAVPYAIGAPSGGIIANLQERS